MLAGGNESLGKPLSHNDLTISLCIGDSQQVELALWVQLMF